MGCLLLGVDCELNLFLSFFLSSLRTVLDVDVDVQELFNVVAVGVNPI